MTYNSPPGAANPTLLERTLKLWEQLSAEGRGLVRCEESTESSNGLGHYALSRRIKAE